jgi:hypothetical protein
MAPQIHGSLKIHVPDLYSSTVTAINEFICIGRDLILISPHNKNSEQKNYITQINDLYKQMNNNIETYFYNKKLSPTLYLKEHTLVNTKNMIEKAFATDEKSLLISQINILVDVGLMLFKEFMNFIDNIIVLLKKNLCYKMIIKRPDTVYTDNPKTCDISLSEDSIFLYYIKLNRIFLPLVPINEILNLYNDAISYMKNCSEHYNCFLSRLGECRLEVTSVINEKLVDDNTLTNFGETKPNFLDRFLSFFKF